MAAQHQHPGCRAAAGVLVLIRRADRVPRFSTDSLDVSQPIDHRRQFLTFVLMLGFFLLWINLAPRLFPSLFGPPPEAPAVADVQPEDAQPAVAPVAAAAESAPTTDLAQFEHRTVLLGDSSQGDWQRVQLTTTGAAIDWQELTEPEFTTLDRQTQVRLLGGTDESQLKTLVVESPAFDVPLQSHGTSLSTVEWEFVADESEPIDAEHWRKAVFRFPSPDGQWEARKTYALRSGQGHDPTASPEGYLLDVELTFRHLTAGAAELTYDLQGPVGLPLENEENTRTFRAAKAGTLEGSSEDSVSFVSALASSLSKDAKAAEEKKDPSLRTVWRYPVKWAGIDVQYFAALLIPAPGQLQDSNGDGSPDPYFAEIVPTVLQETDPVDQSDISLVFKSNKLSVGEALNSEVTHKFQLYLGPKRVQLLEPFLAQKVMDFGWFAPVAKLMVGMLNVFHHSLLLPYGLAIVLLTVIVRGCMFPISKKQVANIQKMKDINPKLQEIRTKYADDKEAQGRAQLELMRKHGYNPLAGCLPMFLQLPIFIGLYNGLNCAIDLRLARFLWINNLAAPDALFQLPGKLPLLGWTEFNLLPLVTIVLFIIQNKLFTPPPTNEEQAMQYKMMNVMMAVMGIMFYHVPAGLCVYFIASSLWGIAERKLLDKHKAKLAAASASGDVIETTAVTVPKTDEPSKAPGFLQRLLEAADQAKHATNAQSSPAAKKSAKNRR